MIATGTPAYVVIRLESADEVSQMAQILVTADQWLQDNNSLPWPIFKELRAAVARARR